jgi:hypothetical protein
MVDEKDNNNSEETREPAITNSSSHDKSLADDSKQAAADIDTSHLTLEESATQAGSTLEDRVEDEAPSIDTSHLSIEESSEAAVSASTAADDFDLDESASEQQPTENPAAPAAHENLVIVDNPLAKKAAAETGSSKAADKPEPSPADSDDAQKVTLNTGQSDEDFEQELEADIHGKSAAAENKVSDEQTDGPIESILSTVKKPENIVRNAWANSSLKRFLLENFETYRVKDEDRNMEDVIEKMYGGASEDGFNIKKFIKDNILFSFLAILFLFLVGWKTAGFLFPDIMPSINDQIIETVQKTTSSKPAAKKAETKKPVVINQANREKIEETLSHCLIEPAARSAFADAFSKTGYEFTNRSLTIAYEEVSDSIKVWQDMNMDFYTRDAVLRYNQLAELALPVILNARTMVSEYDSSLQEMSAKAETLENRIKNIKTSGGNQSTYTINERIPLRNELDKLNARLAEEPDRERFAELLSKLTLAEQVLAGEAQSERMKPDQITEKDPDWLLSVPDTASTEIAQPINEVVLPTIQKPADKLKTVSPKLTAYNLSELETGIDNLLKLSALITYLPENRLIPFKLESAGLSRRLNKLMNKDLPQWTNYNNCLSKTREQAIAITK